MIEENIDHIRGDSEEFTYEINDDAGADVNLTGATIVDFTVKRRISDGDDASVLRKRLGSGATVVDAVTGIVRVVLNAGDTDSLRLGTYRYDVQVRESSGRLSTVATGRFRVKADVSRANT